MPGHSRPKDGVLSPAYVPAIHVFALVMAGLVPAIHVFRLWQGGKTWMPGTRPGMTAPFVMDGQAVAKDVGLARLCPVP